MEIEILSIHLIERSPDLNVLLCVCLVLCCVNTFEFLWPSQSRYRMISSPWGSLLLFIAAAISVPHWPLATTNLCNMLIILSFQGFYINGIIQFVTFWNVVLFFFSSSSTWHNALEIHAGNVSCIDSSFSLLSCSSWYGCITVFFNHSCIEGHLAVSCFLFFFSKPMCIKLLWTTV